MPFICKCQKLYNDKTFKLELYFDFFKSSTDYIYMHIHINQRVSSDTNVSITFVLFLRYNLVWKKLS